MKDKKIIRNFHPAPVTSVCFTNDGQCILAGSADNTVRLLDKNSGEMLGEYLGHRTEDMTIDCAINVTDNYVLSGSVTGEVWCWDLVSAEVANKLCHTKGKVLNSIAVHPSKNVLLTASVYTIKVWSKPDDVKIEPVAV